MSLIIDEIFYNALKTDRDVVEATGGRIYDTCIEVPPTESDNTQLPYVVVMYDGMQNDGSTKDDPYEGDCDNVTVSIEVSAKSRRELGALMKMVRKAVHDYFCDMDEDNPDYGELPEDYQLTASGVAWDWTKPCYYQTMQYNCSTQNDIEL